MVQKLSFATMQMYASSVRAGETVARLARTTEMQEKYEAHKKQNPDLQSFIMSHYLKDCDSCLLRNKFPFPLEPNVSQYVLWLKTPRTFEHVERLVQTAFFPKRIALYENPQDWKSIPGVIHYHIFVEDFAARI